MNKTPKMKGTGQMNNEMTVFEYGNRDIRTIDRDGETWFVAKDVCDALELSHITNALEGVDDDDLTVEFIQSGGQRREMKLVNEPGLYSLIFKSRTDAAKGFKRWVTHDVLPKLRKTGNYSVQAAPSVQVSAGSYWTAHAYVQMKGLDLASNALGKAATQYCRAMGYITGNVGTSTSLYPEHVLDAVAPRQVLIKETSKHLAAQVIV